MICLFLYSALRLGYIKSPTNTYLMPFLYPMKWLQSMDHTFIINMPIRGRIKFWKSFLILDEPLSVYMYFIQSFKDIHRPGFYDDKICNIITALFSCLTRSTTPFIERGRLSDFTKSVVWTNNAIFTYKEKQFLIYRIIIMITNQKKKNDKTLLSETSTI
jgi:hypothetical protein